MAYPGRRFDSRRLDRLEIWDDEVPAFEVDPVERVCCLPLMIQCLVLELPVILYADISPVYIL